LATNFETYIAKRLFFSKNTNKQISTSPLKIAVGGIAVGIAVMILSVAIVTGFSAQVRGKVIGFGSHLTITNLDNNNSLETNPISNTQAFLPELKQYSNVKHVQQYAIKAGIIKTDETIQGAMLKGVGTDFDPSFFAQNLVAGELFNLSDTARTNDVLISQQLATLLKLKVNDQLLMYFVQQPPRHRQFTVKGIYSTGLEEFDKLYVLCDIKHIQRLNDWQTDQITGFEVSLNNFDKIEEDELYIQNNFAYQFNADGSRLRVKSIVKIYPQIFDWLELTKVNVWVILVLMLAVAGFNTISGVLILILERTTTIGVLKAVGASNKSVRTIFIIHGSLLTLKGLLIGNAIGLAVVFLQLHFKLIPLDETVYYVNAVPVQLHLTHWLLLNAGTFLFSVAALVLPSMYISKIKPAEAIKIS